MIDTRPTPASLSSLANGEPVRRLPGRRRAVRALAAAAAIALLALASGALAQAQLPGITVTGTGVAYGEPDMALLNVGVNVYAPSVREALDQADAVMAQVKAAAVALGVDESDVRTTGLYVWREDRYDNEGNIASERYTVRHSYQVVVRQVDSAGEVLSAVVDAGANNVDGIQFTFSDANGLAAEARSLAIADARERAGQLAELGGVTLGSPVAIVEGAPAHYPAAAYAGVAYAEGRGGSSLEAGELAVTVTLTVTFGID